MSPAKTTQKETLIEKEQDQNLTTDNEAILNQNLTSLKDISEELVSNSLIQEGKDVIFNYQAFSNQNLTTDFIELIKNFKLSDTNVKEASELLFSENPDSFDIDLADFDISNFSSILETGKLHAEAPRVWYEWIGGVWRIEFNHELTEFIYYGLVSAWALINVLDLINPFPLFTKITAFIVKSILTNLATGIWNADGGNGTLIRFATWVVPTQFIGSDRDWWKDF